MRPSTESSHPVARRMPGVPLLGSALAFRDDRIGLLSRAYEACGDLGEMYIGPSRFLIVTSAPLARTVLLEQSAAFLKRKALRVYGGRLLGQGIVTSSGDLHRKRRKLMAPPFQPARIGPFAAGMVQTAQQAIGTWLPGSVIELELEMRRITIAIASRFLLGTTIGTVEADEIGDALLVVNRYAAEEMTRLVHLPFGWPTPRNRHVQRAIATIDHIVYGVVRERRAGGVDRGDLLSLLIFGRDDEGGSLNDEQVRDEVMAVLMAGHETTTASLVWTLYLLMSHPEIYGRLRDEVDRALGGRPAGVADLAALQFVTQVFKEAMRLYPPIYVIGRDPIEDVVVGGTRVGPKDSIIINVQGIHRRPDYFEDPERFDPDRFGVEREAAIPRQAYLAFGAGPRVCIGSHFGLMEATLVLATMVQEVSFELVPGQQIEIEALISQRPRNGVHARVRPRPTWHRP